VTVIISVSHPRIICLARAKPQNAQTTPAILAEAHPVALCSGDSSKGRKQNLPLTAPERQLRQRLPSVQHKDSAHSHKHLIAPQVEWGAV